MTADHVVLALPFSILRSSVDYSKAGFNAGQAHRDRAAGHGHELQAHAPVPRPSLAAARPERQHLLRHRLPEHLGGLARAARHERDPRRLHRREHRRELRERHAEQPRAAVPGADRAADAGITAKWNGRATIDFWTAYQWTKGSYSYWKVGQYQAFAGAERERSANCHFAGEHTSIDSQGYLNGAVESGERAATEILGDI